MKIKVYDETTRYCKKLNVEYDNEKFKIKALSGVNFTGMIDNKTLNANSELESEKVLYLYSILYKLINEKLSDTVKSYKDIIKHCIGVNETEFISDDYDIYKNSIKEIRFDITVNQTGVNTYSLRNDYFELEKSKSILPTIIVSIYIFDKEENKKYNEKFFHYTFDEIFDMFFTLHKLVIYKDNTISIDKVNRDSNKGVINESPTKTVEDN